MNRSPPSPRRVALEVNAIDELVRCHGGITLALEMNPSTMAKGKRHRSTTKHIHDLSRRNGELRAELSFYRDCYGHAEKFKDIVQFNSQELLHECIVSIIDSPDLERIRDIASAITTALEELQNKQTQAFEAFLEPYWDKVVKPSPHV